MLCAKRTNSMVQMPALPLAKCIIGLCLTAVLAAVVAITPTSANAAEYIIDRDHTEIRFSWNHLGLSRQSGQFRDVIGRVNFDPENPAATTVDVTIKVSSLMTGVQALDRHLKETAEYFNAVKYPDVIFKSTTVSVLTNTTAILSGNLTINGITKPVALSVVWNFTGVHPLEKVNPVYQGVFVSGFSARAKILRSEFGITRAIPLVSDEISIAIESEMHRSSPPESARKDLGAETPTPEAGQSNNTSVTVEELGNDIGKKEPMAGASPATGTQSSVGSGVPTAR